MKWRQSLQQHDAISDSTLNELLQRRLFAVTRRSLHADLQILTELRWLDRQGLYYQLVDNLPARPVNNTLETTNARISAYTLNFLHPDLENIANNFSQQINGIQRFFLQVDIVIPPSKIDRVDDWQDELRHLWEQSPVPPVKLRYNSARLGKPIESIVYPVCIYYVRRAFYLCAFGQTAPGQGEWYNYRLDRIEQITSLKWTNPSIPRSLFEQYQKASLPTPDYIEVQMANAWGFDFYLPAKLMLLRFDRQFHDRYIQGTFRHDTFETVSYQDCQKLIRQHTREAQQQQTLVKVLQSRSPHDAYYQVYYRDGDRDVGLRLRAWRPFCEVLLPWELRQSMTKEVVAEAQLYQNQ
jgi:CRISPR-associated protein (TIGR03985 family)